MIALANPFTEIERLSWEAPEDLTCSEWADKYRVLGAQVAAVSGPYRTSRAEYCRGIMDALSDQDHREVWFQKPVQCGGSELGRNWIGWQSDADPGPSLIVFPSEEACKETVSERIVPMYRDSPRLRRLVTGKPWDFKTKQVNLRTCSIYVGWSGSPQSLASRPIRRVLFDEVDKYAKWRGVESDPISLGKDRALTYRHRRKIFGLSTPTIPTGAIVKAVRACGDIRHYHIRCHFCGGLDKPEWEKVTWTGRDETDEDSLREQRALLESKEVEVFYKCGLCESPMTQTHIEDGVRQGDWISEGHGRGEHPVSETVGFVLSGICSPWIGIKKLAVEFCSAKLSGLAEMQNFYNAFLGLPFWDSEMMGDAMFQVDAKTLWGKSQAGHAKGIVPEWTQLILCGADSKGLSGHQFVIRAFGAGYRSRLIDYGETDTSKELYDRVFRDYVDVTGRVLKCRRLCVDVGGGKGAGSRDVSRTDEIYRWCRTDPVHLWGVKGHGGTLPPTRQVNTQTQTYHPPGESRKAYDVTVSTLDTQYFKDLVANRINSADPELFEIYAVGRDYVLQLSSERKILAERRIKGEECRDIWRWVPRAAGAANHLWDAEVYCAAAAYMLDMDRPRGGTTPENTPPGYRPKGGESADTHQRSRPRRSVSNKWRIGR